MAYWSRHIPQDLMPGGIAGSILSPIINKYYQRMIPDKIIIIIKK